MSASVHPAVSAASVPPPLGESCGRSPQAPADFRHLRTFITVCETGSIGQASQRLCRTSSAVARSVKELERAFGTDLLVAQKGRLVCTEHGAILRDRATRALHAFATGYAALAGCARPADACMSFPVALFDERRLRILVALTYGAEATAETRRNPLTRADVTRTLNHLERNLGTSLFRRTGPDLAVTAAGAVFARHVQLALVELDRIYADLDHLPEPAHAA